MMHDTDIFLAAAWEAAEAAGELIRDNWQQPKEIGYKGAIDLVTSIDRDSERLIVSSLRQKFPDHSVLAEEGASISGAQTSPLWIVDPLDGTTNFAHGYPHFCISIALEVERAVILGLVYDPLRRECFSAVKERGATLNRAPIRVSAISKLDNSLLATGFPYDRREHAGDYLRYFKEFMIRSQGIRRGGSAALDLCYVACGRLEGFWELKLRAWDTAAGSLIVTEAGGRLSDFYGREYSIWGTETVASNGAIHHEMTAVIRAIRETDCVD